MTSLDETAPAALIDRELDRQMMGLYLDGDQPSEARWLLYGVRWRANLSVSDLPLASSSLKSFSNLCRDKLRDPIVKEALVLGIAGGLRETETSVAAAAAMALQYDTLARPSEVIVVAWQWIVSDSRP